MKDEARRVEDYHHDLISLRLKNVKSQRMDNSFNRFLAFTHLEKVVYLQ